MLNNEDLSKSIRRTKGQTQVLLEQFIEQTESMLSSQNDSDEIKNSIISNSKKLILELKKDNQDSLHSPLLKDELTKMVDSFKDTIIIITKFKDDKEKLKNMTEKWKTFERDLTDTATKYRIFINQGNQIKNNN